MDTEKSQPVTEYGSPRRIILSDIDGVVCDSWERYQRFYPKGWIPHTEMGAETKAQISAYSSTTEGDKPLSSGISLIRGLSSAFGDDVYFLTSRNIEGFDLTLAWLRHNVFPDFPASRLLMRPTGTDHHEYGLLPAPDYKRFVLGRLQSAGLRPVFALDDEYEICKMYQAEGIPALHVCLPGIPSGLPGIPSG